MKVVTQSYEIMNLMLKDEILTDQDKIIELNKFIETVEYYMLKIIMPIDDIKECNELLKTFEIELEKLKCLMRS